MGRIYKILSIDGGGIRGIIPAMVLSRIEEETGKPVARMFDLIAGTSTGGILALALSIPGAGGQPKYSAKDLIQLYENEGPVIFDRNVWHDLHSLWGVADSKYPESGIESVLKKYFGQTRLSEALTEVLVTSYDIEGRRPLFFKSTKARQTPATRDFLMWEIARSTSAAPTYFDPYQLVSSRDSQNRPRDYYVLVDGGTFANNPAMCAYVEAITMFRDQEDFQEAGGNNVLMLSLGTGELTRRLPYEKARNWGLAQWVKPVIDVVFDGVSDTVSYQLEQLLPPSGDRQRYYRFQTKLIEGSDDMDDSSPTNLRVLKLIAQEMIHDKGAELSSLIKQLA